MLLPPAQILSALQSCDCGKDSVLLGFSGKRTFRLRSCHCHINSISTLQQLNSAQDKQSSWSIQFTTLQSHSCIPSSRCTIIKTFYSCFSEICHGIDVQSFREQFKTTSQGCLQWVCYSGPYRSWVSLSGNAKPPASFACTRFWQSELLTLLSYALDEQDHVRPPGRNANPPLAKQSGSPHHDHHIPSAAVGSWSKTSPVLI